MSRCPSQEELQALLARQLGDTERISLEDHIQRCSLCQNTLEILTNVPEASAWRLHEPARSPDDEDLLLRLKDIPSTLGRSGAESEASGHADLPCVPGYEILRELGRGGMGVVYEARQIQLKRLVALKMILPHHPSGSASLQRFRREAEAVARLAHPNIVQIHEVGERDGLPYFSLELVEGGSLAQRLRGTPLAAKTAAELVEALAGAVEHAHRHGIIHRDLKPSNILLAAHIPKITDFGLAKQMDDESEATHSGVIVGTPSYMAPEQAAGRSRDIGPAVDIYALGAILYECLTGRPPFRAVTPVETALLVVAGEIVPLSRLQPGLPRDLETICLTCLRREPNRRYASAADLAEDLRRFRAGEPIAARRAGSVERLWRWSRRKPALAGLIAVAAIALVVIVGGGLHFGFMLRQQRDRADEARDDALDKLRESYIVGARDGRLTREAGQRWTSLEALKEAAGIRPSPALSLRNETIACLALTDFRLAESQPSLDGALAATYDPTFAYYARAEADGAIRVRQVTDDREVQCLPAREHPARWLSFSPDGRWLAAHHRLSDGREARLAVWDWRAGRRIQHQAISAPCLTWDCRRQRLIVALDEGGLLVRDLSGGADRTIPLDYRPHYLVHHPYYPWVAISAQNSPVVQIRQLHDDKFGSIVATLPHPGSVFGLDWSPDGRRLATTCADVDRRIFLWDVENKMWSPGRVSHVSAQLSSPEQHPNGPIRWDGKTSLRITAPHMTLKGHNAEPTRVAFSRGGDLLVSAGWDGALRLWDAWTGRQLVADTGRHLIDTLRFSPDDRRLACAGYSDGTLALYQVERGQDVMRTLYCYGGADKGPAALSFSPDSSLLATLSSWNRLELWDAASGLRHDHQVTLAVDLLFDPRPSDGDQLLLSSRWGFHRRSIHRGVPGEKPARIGELKKARMGTLGCQMAASSDGRCLAFGTPDRRSVVVLREEDADAETPGRSLRNDRPAKQLTLSGYPGLYWIAVSADGCWVAATSQASGLRVWDARTGHTVKDLPHLPDAMLAFSPDNRWLVAGTARGYRFWEVETWKDGVELPRNVHDIRGPAAFSSDSRLFAFAPSHHEVRIVETRTWRTIAQLESINQQMISRLFFSPDGGRLAVACPDHLVLLWELKRIRERLAEMNLDWE